MTIYIPYFGAALHSFSWRVGGFFAPMLTSMTAFMLIYRIFPATQVRFKDILPGALMATVLFELGKQAFRFYLKNFAKYDVIFGSLGAIVSFLFYYGCTLALQSLLFGAEVCSDYRRLRSIGPQT
jgi:membrane protein